MKLPVQQTYDTPHAPLQDPRSPLVEANLRAGVFASVGANISGAMDRYTERETKRQIQEANLNMQTRMIELQRKYGNVQDFDLSNPAFMDDPMVMEAAASAGIQDMNATIPAHRIMPEIYNKSRELSIEEFGSIISDEESRNTFTYNHTQARLKKYMQDSAAASKEQIKYIGNQTAQKVDEHLNNDDFSGASLAVTTSQMSNSAKFAALQGITAKRQKFFFDERLKYRDLKGMTEALAKLKDPMDPDSSGLTSSQELAYTRSFEAAIKTEADKKTTSKLASVKMVKKNARYMLDSLNNGDMVDPTNYANTYDTIVASGDEVLATQMEWAVQTSANIHDMKHGNIKDIRKAASQRMVSGDGFEAYSNNKLGEAARKTIKAIKSDTMQFMLDNGIVEMAPVTFDEAEQVPAMLVNRMVAVETARSRYNYTSGYLTDDEDTAIGEYLDSATDQEKGVLFAGIHLGLRDEAPFFYEELKNKNIGGTTPLAGQLWAEGYRRDASILMKGATVRKDASKIVMNTDARNGIDAEFTKQMGNMFKGNGTQLATMNQAIYNAYAALSNDAGDFDGEYDRKRAIASINIASGGIIEYNDSYLQSPRPDVAYKEFNDWINVTDAEALFSGTNAKQSPQEIKELVQKGVWKLRGIGRGVFHIHDGSLEGGILYNADGATAFQVRYNEGLQRSYNKPTDNELDRMRAQRGIEYSALEML